MAKIQRLTEDQARTIIAEASDEEEMKAVRLFTAMAISSPMELVFALGRATPKGLNIQLGQLILDVAKRRTD